MRNRPEWSVARRLFHAHSTSLTEDAIHPLLVQSMYAAPSQYTPVAPSAGVFIRSRLLHRLLDLRSLGVVFPVQRRALLRLQTLQFLLQILVPVKW